MTDIVERMKDAACPANTGCMSIKTCVCDVMGDAVDEIERLRLTVMELCVAHGKLGDENDELRERIKALRAGLKAICDMEESHD